MIMFPGKGLPFSETTVGQSGWLCITHAFKVNRNKYRAQILSMSSLETFRKHPVPFIRSAYSYNSMYVYAQCEEPEAVLFSTHNQIQKSYKVKRFTFPSSPTSSTTRLIVGNLSKAWGSRCMNRLHSEASRSLMAGSGTLRRKSSRFSTLEPRTVAGGEKNASRASDATDVFVLMPQCRISSLIRRMYLVARY